MKLYIKYLSRNSSLIKLVYIKKDDFYIYSKLKGTKSLYIEFVVAGGGLLLCLNSQNIGGLTSNR